MSYTAGTDEQVLSLPKGGGAVRGLGTTFETDLNTGTGSYAIPLDLPAGQNGICPQLSIRYNSAAGNGTFGMGWTLGLMAISRKIEGRIPNYEPSDDAFVLVGVEDLVALGDGQYRPQVDTLHWRIERRGDGWELTDTKGTCYRLGQTAQSRVEIIEDGLTKTAIWLLESMEDTNGNIICHRYRQDGAQRYLEQIEWGTYVLKFIYEERPDRLSNGRYGFLLKTDLLCDRIELYVTTVAPSLVRSWSLEYIQASGSALSLLYQVTLRGHAADSTILEAPCLTLGYTEARAPNTLEKFSGVAPGISPGTFANQQLELLDWDGNGLPDLLEIGGGSVKVWPNLGRCQWGWPKSLPRLPAPIALEEPGIAFADMEGNGTADLILLDRPLAGYYPHKPRGGFDMPVSWDQAPSARLSAGNARLVDLDGNGVIDLLETGEYSFNLYYRNFQDGWELGPSIPLSRVPPVSFRDPHVHLADMNGDGLQDLVRIDRAGVEYWPYLGNGRWAKAEEMGNPPQLPPDFEPERLYCRDIDGDGCADLVYVGYDRVIYWLNQCGVGFSEPQEIPGTPLTPREKLKQLRLADMKGTGTVGLLWSGFSTRNEYLYLDFTDGIKPYLLTRIDNGLGLETHIRYRSSTEFALDDADAGKPWQTFHPFPVLCVAELEVQDTIAGKSSLIRHHYHNGRYDGQARTFLGFEVVDVEAIGDEAIPTLRTRNVYHLGLDSDDLERSLTNEERQRLGALRRRVLRTEVKGLDGSAQQDRPYQIVKHEYDVRVEPVANGAAVFVPYETRTLEEQYERENTPFAFREITYLEIDEYGNILRQRNSTWRANHKENPDQDITTQATFAINSEAHIVSLPARVTQRDATGNVLSVTVTQYDGSPHQGLSEGQITSGNVTRQETLAITDELATATYGADQPDWEALGYHCRPGEDGWWTTQVSYERQDTAAGLTLITRNPRGFDTRLDYDQTRQYPQHLTDAGGNLLKGEVDERVFQMASLTDANGHTVLDRFDALGRVIATIKPGDTPVLPTSIFRYRTDELPAQIAIFQRENSGQPDTLDEYQYFDGRGELIQQIAEGEGDTGRHFIVQECREHTTRGQVSVRYLPYYVDSQEYVPPPPNHPKLQMRFDALGRLVEQLKASGARITQTFGPGYIEPI